MWSIRQAVVTFRSEPGVIRLSILRYRSPRAGLDSSTIAGIIYHIPQFTIISRDATITPRNTTDASDVGKLTEVPRKVLHKSNLIESNCLFSNCVPQLESPPQCTAHVESSQRKEVCRSRSDKESYKKKGTARRDRLARADVIKGRKPVSEPRG